MGGRGRRKQFFKLLFLMYSLGRKEGGNLTHVLLAVRKSVSLNLTLVVSYLGLSTSLAIWGPGGTGLLSGVCVACLVSDDLCALRINNSKKTHIC